MDRLWAPWRIRYVQNSKKEKGCLFCKAYRVESPKKNYVVLKTEHSLVMLNIYPYNNGHLMVAPRRHVATLEKCTPPEMADLMACVQNVIPAVRKILKPAGFNVGMNIGKVSGAGIAQHLHIHVVPRWQGDSNFMPVCAQTKIISQSLNEFYRRLKKELNLTSPSKRKKRGGP